MNPFIELMSAGALIMLLFAAVLISVVIRNTTGPKKQLRLGPGIVGIALLLFAIPIYASVMGTDDLNSIITGARVAGAILLPIGLYLLGSREEVLRSAEPDRDKK